MQTKLLERDDQKKLGYKRALKNLQSSRLQLCPLICMSNSLKKKKSFKMCLEPKGIHFVQTPVNTSVELLTMKKN